jgi:hypothetical protein
MDLEAGVEQMATMWTMMLGQFTASGSTRMELAEFSMLAAATILSTTKDNLWPVVTDHPEEGQTIAVGEGEEEAAKGFHSVLVQVAAVRRTAFPK